MTANVQSVVTPKASRSKASLKASVAPVATLKEGEITKVIAIETAYTYGESLAGYDGAFTKAIAKFKNDNDTLNEMLKALNLGYLVKKLAVSKAEAERIFGLLKYNDQKIDDLHRTAEQQRVMDTVRVLWSRAKAMAGVPKTESAAKAEATRAQKEEQRKEHESRLIKADELINPKDDTDPFDALSRLVLTMKSLQNKYSAKLQGDRGTAWRDWLANAPK